MIVVLLMIVHFFYALFAINKLCDQNALRELAISTVMVFTVGARQKWRRCGKWGGLSKMWAGMTGGGKCSHRDLVGSHSSSSSSSSSNVGS